MMTTLQSVAYQADRDVRQRDLVPPDRIARCQALVIGVGAIGRQVAVQLAALGIPVMHLIDHDIVAVENLAPQAYWPADLGRLKVDATADLCRSIHPPIRLQARPERFRRSSTRTIANMEDGKLTVVFCCVDSIETRRLIWESIRYQIGFWADGRMSAEVVRVLASDSPSTDHDYGSTLFPESQAYAGSCTSKATVYSAAIAAGLMICQFTRWLRHLPVDRDVMLNLLSMELAVS